MNVILGVTGSISAYKAIDVLRIFQKNGHQVSVIMTESATKLISPLSFDTFIPGRVYKDMFGIARDSLVHVDLCKKNDLLIIAPATANIIGKMANGIADDLLSTIFLAFYRKVVIAPAMNSHMYNNPVVLENISKLRTRGVNILEPEKGSLACADEGIGRLPPAEKIFTYCMEVENV